MLNERKMSIEEILNYGIPYADSICLPINDLFVDKNKYKKHTDKLYNVLFNNFGDLGRYGFDVKIGMKTEYINEKRVISYDCRSFVYSLVTSLGVKYDGNLNDNESVVLCIKKHIRNLKTELKGTTNLHQMESLVPNLCKNMDPQLCKLLSGSNIFYKHYVDNFCDALSKISLNLKYVCEFLKQPLPYDAFNGIDREKLLFYIACSSFAFSEYKSNESFHNGIYTTMKYILEKGKDYNKNLAIKNMRIIISDTESVSSKSYSYKDLLTDYNAFLKANPNIKEEIINPKRIEGKTLREINDYLELYRLTCGRTLDANWELLPEGKREDNGVHYYTAKVRKNNKKIDSKVEKVYREKIDFFENSEPLFRIFGKDKFEGYSGFIYKNGLVFFEKIGSDDKMAKNTALYVMNIYNFIQFSQLTKQQIIEYNKNEEGSKITRINHNINWQQRATDILESQTDISMDEVNEVIERQFVKKR